MTNGLTTEVEKTEHHLDGKTLLSVVAGGDCAALTPEQKVMYYRARCEAAGLDYRAQPFQFIKLQGKETLYATKAATDQLASRNGIKCEVVSQVTENGIRTVTVRSSAKDGRQTDEIGCVTVQGLAGDALANAYMKAVTKAKRRAILSISGLGMIDETELETIPPSNAPPSLPPPRRRSEVVKEAPKAEPRPVEVSAATQEAVPLAEQIQKHFDAEPLVVPDDGTEEVQVVTVDEKPTKKGGKSYGIKVQPDGEQEAFYVNTFSDTQADLARSCKETGEAAIIKRKPREYNGKTYWDLVSIEPANRGI